MNPKNFSKYLRPYFSRHYRKEPSFFGLFSSKNWVLYIRADMFEQAVIAAVKGYERDLAIVNQIAPKTPVYVQPRLIPETQVQLELPNPDVVQALMNLGYKKREAVPACTGLHGTVEDQIVKALRRLGR